MQNRWMLINHSNLLFLSNIGNKWLIMEMWQDVWIAKLVEEKTVTKAVVIPMGQTRLIALWWEMDIVQYVDVIGVPILIIIKYFKYDTGIK